jgi:hypothetical protein
MKHLAEVMNLACIKGLAPELVAAAQELAAELGKAENWLPPSTNT